MKHEYQICTLKQTLELEKLGVNLESLWSWVFEKPFLKKEKEWKPPKCSTDKTDKSL